ncbi:MAG: hypothetical protein WBQ25_02295 [Nitrososphaeraceae archaeon]
MGSSRRRCLWYDRIIGRRAHSPRGRAVIQVNKTQVSGLGTTKMKATIIALICAFLAMGTVQSAFALTAFESGFVHGVEDGRRYTRQKQWPY